MSAFEHFSSANPRGRCGRKKLRIELMLILKSRRECSQLIENSAKMCIGSKANVSISLQKREPIRIETANASSRSFHSRLSSRRNKRLEESHFRSYDADFLGSDLDPLDERLQVVAPEVLSGKHHAISFVIDWFGQMAI